MVVNDELLPMDKDVVSIARTERELDTTVVIELAQCSDLFDLYLKKIAIKPAKRLIPLCFVDGKSFFLRLADGTAIRGITLNRISTDLTNANIV